jgi:hypothetical protein
MRIDSSVHFLGLRLDMYIACTLTVVGAVWFSRSQRRLERPEPEPAAAEPEPAEERDPEQAASGG